MPDQAEIIERAATEASRLRVLLAVPPPPAQTQSVPDALAAASMTPTNTETPRPRSKWIRLRRLALPSASLVFLGAVSIAMALVATEPTFESSSTATSFFYLGIIAFDIFAGLGIATYWAYDMYRKSVRHRLDEINFKSLVVAAVGVSVVGMVGLQIFFSHPENPIVRFGVLIGFTLALVGFLDFLLTKHRRNQFNRDRIDLVFEVAESTEMLIHYVDEVSSSHLKARYGDLLDEAVSRLQDLGSFRMAEHLAIEVPTHVREAQRETHQNPPTPFQFERGHRGVV